MKILNLGHHIIEVYDSIDNLPIVRFHKFSKLLLIDAGIGSDISDFDNHIQRAIYFCKSNSEMAIKELENLRNNVFFIQSEINLKHLAFCSLIKSIDNIECSDISDEGLKKTQSLIMDLSNSEIIENLNDLKKKIDEELSLYFPSLFDDATIKEYYDLLKKRTLELLNGINSEKIFSEEYEKLTSMLITYLKPSSFEGSESLEIKHDKQFENMCLLLSQKLKVTPKKFTTLEYFNSFEFLKELNKKGKTYN